jgi:hypothetical protein
MAQDAKERARDEQARGFYADRVDGGAGDHRRGRIEKRSNERSMALIAESAWPGYAVVTLRTGYWRGGEWAVAQGWRGGV